MRLQEVVDGFNRKLEEENSILVLEIVVRGVDREVVNITFREDENLNREYHSVVPSDVFYTKLAEYFREDGITKLNYNNTHTTFWV